jgi:hypothetical protein
MDSHALTIRLSGKFLLLLGIYSALLITPAGVVNCGIDE